MMRIKTLLVIFIVVCYVRLCSTCSSQFTRTLIHIIYMHIHLFDFHFISFLFSISCLSSCSYSLKTLDTSLFGLYLSLFFLSFLPLTRIMSVPARAIYSEYFICSLYKQIAWSILLFNSFALFLWHISNMHFSYYSH